MAAPAWKRILKWSAWLLGGALAVPIVCYVALLVINWRDQPPSAAALYLEAQYRNRPAVAEADNAYPYVMGFEVAPDADPREAGIRRIDWIRKLPEEATYPLSDDPVIPDEAYRSSRSPRAQKISDACRRAWRDCSAALEGGDDEIRAWIASEQWLLDRYLTLLQHPDWLETVPYDARVRLTEYQAIADGQRLLISKAYVLAAQNNASAVRELLGNDIRFWRRVLASGDILITKMIAVAALNRTFGMGNLALRRLPAELQLAALPTEWTVPLSDEERSMLRCLTGEWLQAGLMLDRTMNRSTTSWFDTPVINEQDFPNSMVGRAFMPMFQLQHTLNLQAESFIQATEALNVPIERFAIGLDQAQRIYDNQGRSDQPLANLYNPIGRAFLWFGGDLHVKYPPRVADVEGMRRAAVLTTELRARKVPEQNISAELVASETRTPYTGEPFTWDAEERAVVFVGMVPGERGRYDFKY